MTKPNKPKHTMRLYPFDKVVEQASEIIAMGASVYQQFNCAACGTKQTIETPNKFHKLGTCEECNHTTDIVRDGCNFVAVFGHPQRDAPHKNKC